MSGILGKFFKFILILLGLALLAGYYIGSAHAIDYTITLSDACIASLKINSTVTNCPSYADILTVFPDQSLHKISGGFVFSDNYLHREPSGYKNQYRYYDYFPLESRLWVDPPHDVLRYSKNIVIAASSFEYKLIGKMRTDTTGKNEVYIGHNRYINKSCSDAIITSENWISLLGDTLVLMQHDCDPAFTNFDERKLVQWQRNYHDITTSYKYKFDMWQKESIAKCGSVVCILR